MFQLNTSLFIISFVLFGIQSPAQTIAANLPGSKEIERHVRIGRSNIFFYKKGVGVPVVFVSGLGEDHQNWQTVQDSVSQFLMTMSYDRSGLGRSEYHQEKKDLSSMVEELDEVTRLATVTKPFILVGHSLGCQVVKAYAAKYPQNIRGIIFIDPGYNEDNLRARVTDAAWHERESALKKYLPKFSLAQEEELKLVNRSAAISDSIKSLPEVPIVLFTATLTNPDFPCSAEELAVKKKSHELWLQTLPGAVHLFVSSSRHYIQNDEPGIIINEIKKMAKSGQD